MRGKKGVSPVIATTLLILIVIVLGGFIYIWAVSFVGEALTKQDKNVEQACGEVDLSLSYRDNKLQIINSGNVPVFNLKIKKFLGASIDSYTYLKHISVGASDTIDNIEKDGEVYDKLEVFPVILGTTDSGEKNSYVCENHKFTAYSK